MTPNEFLERLRREWEDRGGAGQRGKPPSFQVDWREYFRRFCQAHGGAAHPPFMKSGRLWFFDGWGYSATDWAGPEYPPPADKDELTRVKRIYWKLRRTAVRLELFKATYVMEEIERLVASHDLVPPVRVEWWEDDESLPGGGKWNQALKDIDVGEARERVRWLQDDLTVCEFKIADPDWEGTVVEGEVTA